ncbi:4'-phosphopantetheinyl transferase family protein [Streptomyces cadmiisoli]|uniref:4'-phosphopantetheinyl transferase family protein n=1 Tax=Streptomyces cadmiisoli TaxID=2184053 RepID=UPI003D742748
MAGAGLPVAVTPRGAGWAQARAAAARYRHVVCHGRLADWAAADGPSPCELLGADWPRYRSAREPDVRARLMGSRLLLRGVVAAVAGTEPERVRLGRDGNGRPVVLAPPGLDAGLSHTAGVLVAGAAAGRRIGVDVEAASRCLLAPGLAGRFCHPRELAGLRQLPPRERNLALVRRWTLKEAYTKALGVGLAHDFTRLCPRPEQDGDGWTLGSGAPGWRLRCDEVDGGFLVARALGPWAPASPPYAGPPHSSQ